MELLRTIPAFVWLLISAVFFAWGEYLSKKWGMQPSLLLACIVVAVYGIGTFAWLPALLHKNQLAVVGTLWLLLAILATVSIGVLVFHEHLTAMQWVGVVLGFVALGLIGG